MMVSDGIGGDASIGSTSLSTRLTMVQDDDLDEEGDVLATPGSEKNRWAASGTPSAANRAKRTKGNGAGVTLTLRDQEKHIDSLKKENFNIKLRVHFLEEQLAKLAPDQIDAALKQNINLKIEVQQRGMEIKKLKKLVLSLEHELERLQRSDGNRNRERERELEDKLEERELELRDLRRRNSESLERSGSRAAQVLEEREEREALEDELDDLRDQLASVMLELQQKEEELDLKSKEIEDLVVGRSESRSMVLEEREEREAVEDDLNALRDRLAAVMIELQQKEDEVEVKSKEIEDLVAEHQRIVEVVEDEWRGEVEEARVQVEELKDVLAEREAESKDLRVNISELEANTDILHNKFQAAFAHMEEEADENEAKIEGMQETIDQLGEQIYHLEDDNDRLKEEGERIREEELAERERLELLSIALKEKISTLGEELQQMTEMYETCSHDIHAHRSRQEELAQHVEELVSQLQSERTARQQAENELDEVDNDHNAHLREHTTARFSLQLETDRMKRDMERLEAELTRARQDLSDKDAKTRERDSLLDNLHAENRDLQTQLGVQTQARLNVAEKLDVVLANLKDKEEELAAMKKRVNELEGRLEKDQRTLLGQESQYRDQVTERNTLLLTIYQYLDKIIGVDKTPKKSGQAETKPFTNFSVFHDNLITRLKALSQIQMDFDRRCKEIEARFTEKLGDMRKQLDNRWKQIDRFESSLKSYADTKVAWKRKLSQKEGELEAIKATNTEMATQLSNMKRPNGPDSMELRSLTTRAANAERRLNNAQNQLLTTEEKLANMNQKTTAADGKWEARVKEYEARLKAAEERVKRERQGSKERVAELENSVKNLQRQLELAQKRNNHSNEVVEAGESSPPR